MKYFLKKLFLLLAYTVLCEVYFVMGHEYTLPSWAYWLVVTCWVWPTMGLLERAFPDMVYRKCEKCNVSFGCEASKKPQVKILDDWIEQHRHEEHA